MNKNHAAVLRCALIALIAALPFVFGACWEEYDYDDDYGYNPPHDHGTPPPDPAPDPIPPDDYIPYNRYDVSFVVSALAFDYETDEIVGDVEILYSINDRPYYSLGYSEYEPWYTPLFGDIPDALVNFGDPNDGPVINIGDMYEDEVVYLTLVAEDPVYEDYFPRYIDLTIYNEPDGVRIVSEGADIDIEMAEADYFDPIFPVRAIFDLEWRP
jgi:hypothetical protein